MKIISQLKRILEHKNKKYNRKKTTNYILELFIVKELRVSIYCNL